ncbi:hypothetical protein [Cellulomonas massiliensis]|nr:hypothetical protein [Cellulomonas massiliensis]
MDENIRDVEALTLADATGIWALGTHKGQLWLLDADDHRLALVAAPDQGAEGSSAAIRWSRVVLVLRAPDTETGVLHVGSLHLVELDHDNQTGTRTHFVPMRITSISRLTPPGLVAPPSPPARASAAAPGQAKASARERRHAELRARALAGDAVVVLPDGEHVVIKDLDEEPIVLPDRAVQDLFAVGLALGPTPRVRKRDRPRLVVDDRAEFRAGGVDLSVKEGLRAVRDGLAYAVRRGLEDARADVDQVLEPEPAADLPATAHDPPVPGEAGELTVDLTELGAPTDDLLDQVTEHGRRIVLTNEGHRSAVLLPWPQWRDLNRPPDPAGRST